MIGTSLWLGEMPAYGFIPRTENCKNQFFEIPIRGSIAESE